MFLLVVNALLAYQAFKYYQKYTAAGKWPEAEATVQDVTIQRVNFVQRSSPINQEYYEATLHYRYTVDGSEYNKTITKTTAGRAEAEALKEQPGFLVRYNPANPTETLDSLPSKIPLMIMLGLLGIAALSLLYSLYGLFIAPPRVP